MRIRIASLLLLNLVLWTSCKDNSVVSQYDDLDLLSHGIPLKIKAPADAEVAVDDMGIVQDITVKAGDDFSLQIIAGTAYLNNLKEIVEKQKADAIASKTFSKLVEEYEHGFIFEKKYSEERISYDFRHVRLQGDKEYIFQTGLLGQFTLDQVKNMYEAVE